ncbi:MAG: hypothetical protein ACHQHN_06480 [Sphingobacteriales bacterium]
MKSALVIFISCIISFTTSNLKAQTKPENNTKEALSYVSNFFHIYETQGSDKAFDYIATKNTSAIIAKSKWDYLKSKLDTINSVVGIFTGYELITEKKVGESLVLFSYMVKHKNYPLRFTFVFYKPENHWVVQNVLFDADDMIEELKQSSKIDATNTNH